MKKQILSLVSIPILGGLGSIALRLKVDWLAILLYLLMIAALIYVLISSRKVEKEVRELEILLRDMINQGEIINPVFSTKEKFFKKDDHVLKEYMKKIDYDASLMTDFLSGLLDNVSFQYRDELLVGKNIKHTKEFAVISFKNDKSLTPRIIENHSLLSSKYEESYIVIDKEYVSYYIVDSAIISKSFNSADLLNKGYADLITFIRSMIYINEIME